MILKLLIHFYAWVWNVEPWVPKNGDDFFPIVMGVMLFDIPALVGLGFILWPYIKSNLLHRK